MVAGMERSGPEFDGIGKGYPELETVGLVRWPAPPDFAGSGDMAGGNVPIPGETDNGARRNLPRPFYPKTAETDVKGPGPEIVAWCGVDIGIPDMHSQRQLFGNAAEFTALLPDLSGPPFPPFFLWRRLFLSPDILMAGDVLRRQAKHLHVLRQGKVDSPGVHFATPLVPCRPIRTLCPDGEWCFHCHGITTGYATRAEKMKVHPTKAYFVS